MLVTFSRGFVRRLGELVITMVDANAFSKVISPELLSFADLFKTNNYKLRIAGGAVRDLLMGISPSDIDFATDATPQEMKTFLDDNPIIRRFNFGGESHGTISCRVNDRENFEVTTLRIDVETDGRHAQISYTTDWQLDASRRDLTVNAMFLDLEGNLYDYFNGQEDLKNRTIRFVGDPTERIIEDYLRILRYFRFYGKISREPDQHDSSVLLAIKENVDGLSKISGERLWVELKKIFAGNHVPFIMQRMKHAGIFPYLGLPETSLDTLKTVWNHSSGFSLHPLTLAATMLESIEQLDTFHSRLKLSNNDYNLAAFIIDNRFKDFSQPSGDGRSFVNFRNLLLNGIFSKYPKIKEHLIELLKYLGERDCLEKIIDYDVPRFPVNGADLIQQGIVNRSSFSVVLRQLHNAWLNSDCLASKSDLLAKVLDIHEMLVTEAIVESSNSQNRYSKPGKRRHH